MPRSNPLIRQGLVVFAKDKRRVSAFYQRTLELKVVEKSASHHLLHGPGTEIVIHAIPRAIAAEISITRPPAVRAETPLKPTFFVRDLEHVRAEANATGGWLKPAEQAWTIRGATVLDGWDPEGNVVQFKQRHASRARGRKTVKGR